jgi:predicted choloylglycine hydrolase
VGDLAQFGLVIVRRPAGKRAFASVTFPGVLVCGSEMNDAGLALGANDVRQTKDGSPKLDPKGTPLAVAGRRLMEDCGSLAEAEKFLRPLKATTTGNLILCDAKGGVVVEATSRAVKMRRAEAGVCVCTNHFRSPDLAVSTECWRYDKLESYRRRPKLSLEDVAAALHAVNQGKATVHSMIFEPAALRLHVAVGPGPVTKQPRAAIDLGPLFKE